MVNSEAESTNNTRRRQSDEIRLESWKAIANYLNRSVRTVRRWESDGNLPVRRQRHSRGASVYAFCSELDAWRRHNREADAVSLPEPPENHKEWRFAQLSRYAAILFIGAFVGTVVSRFVQPIQPIPNVESSPNVDPALTFAPAGDDDNLAIPASQIDNIAYWPENVARRVVSPILSAWAEGRMEDVLRESYKLSEQLPNFSPETQAYLIDHFVDISLAMGRVDDARRFAAVEPDSDRRYELQTRVLFALGDKDLMRAHLQSGDDFEDESTALFMAMAGLFDKAIALESALGTAETRSRKLDVILAMSSIESGDSMSAVSRLQAVTSVLEASDSGYYFVALDMLSGVLQSEGHLADSIRVLEKTMPERESAAHNSSGLFWLMCQRKLAKQYRIAGRESDAVRLENELRDVLIFSDESFPLAQSLTNS